MSGPVAAAAEPGLVAIEWPTAELGEEWLRPEAHAALMTVARAEAKKLGLRPRDGGSQVYTVDREGVSCLRFVWAADR